MYRISIAKIYKKISQTMACFLVVVCIASPATAQAQQTSNTVVESQVVDGQGDNRGIKIQRKRRGIEAELVDQGDYYMHPDGRQIRMLRKKDVYVIESNDTARSTQRLKGQYGSRVIDLASDRLGGQKMVRIDNSDAVKRSRNETFDVNASMLKSSDNSIRNLKSVFANEQGDGDILLMPKLTVKLAADANPMAALNRLDRRYGLSLDRKLRVSGNVYSLSLKTDKTESQQFALVRSVMNDSMVEWASPQFIVRAEKTSFEPNDTLINQQWHLQNTGFRGSRCDTDCDANNAWGVNVTSDSVTGGNPSGNDSAVVGDGMVIAVIDDGVQLDHEDLKVSINGGEKDNPNSVLCVVAGDKCNNGIDDDGDGYVDNWRGWDFVIDSDSNNRLEDVNSSGPGTCSDGFDGFDGQDNDPNPQATSNCVTVNGDDVENDDHGTAVAGLAAAVGNNNQGVAGTAFSAEILPIRLISDFDTHPSGAISANDPNNDSFCIRAAEAMEYAGVYADVVSNSWSLPVVCPILDVAIANVTSGNVVLSGQNSHGGIASGQTSKRPNGSPVLFASGNQASGWVNVSIPVSAGEHAYEWRFLRDAGFDNPDDGDRAWLDDISWPGQSSVGVDFETNDLAGYGFDIGNVSAGNSCTIGCGGGFLSGNAAWSIASPPETLSGTQAAVINAASTDCGNTYLHILRDEPSSGNISFWVWVDTDTSADKFEFLIDGEERLSFGDFESFVENGVIAYPADLTSTIAVGASNSGDLSGNNPAGLAFERRAYYSQYGTSLDVLAPSSDQSIGIVTTDRMGSDGYDSNSNYTNTFGGTSASTPIVAGIAASILAVANDPNLSASDVRDILRRTTDKIGDSTLYASDGNGDTRSEFYGYGRVSMFKAILDADPQLSVQNAPAQTSCTTEPFSFTSAHNIFQSSSLAFCPAIGEVPEIDEFCFPIKATNGNIVVVCL